MQLNDDDTELTDEQIAEIRLAYRDYDNRIELIHQDMVDELSVRFNVDVETIETHFHD